MGGCVSPTLANIFLGFHEKKWLQECPADYKPVYYKRYVDDTFLLFKKEEERDRFLRYLNDKHDNISFTCEREQNGKLSFLDVTVSKTNNSFSTSVYKKQTSTGQGMNYYSAVSKHYKSNLIQCLVDRAFKISSSYVNFNNEIGRLRKYFSQNFFPVDLVEKRIKQKIDSLFHPKLKSQSASKFKLYCSLPYLSEKQNKNISSEVD